MPQIREGTVISKKMEKTVVIKVSSKIKHRLYKKLTNRTKNFKAHSDQELKIGQKVKIIETKPYAKNVHFKILEVLE